ncbi:MAG: hypothetical protein H6563_05345 [Lewinellaceae bacterium]|nr:hypothetical protein [Lewinellaceae bacterium]
MQGYKTISIVLFSLIMTCLLVMAFSRSFWLIVVLAGAVPVFVVIQVWAVLRGKKEEPTGEEEKWYERD